MTEEQVTKKLGGIANRFFHDSPMAYTWGHTFTRDKALKVAKEYRKELDRLIRDIEKGTDK